MDESNLLPDFVWNHPDFLKELEQRAEEEQLMSLYEKGSETG